MRDANEFFSHAAAALKRKTVTVQGITLHLREFTLHERKEFVSQKDVIEAAPTFLIRSCVVDEEGKPIFAKADEQRIAALPPALVDEIVAEVMKLSGIKDETPASATAPTSSSDAEAPPEKND